MPMLITCVCSTCSKVNISVVNSGMISDKMFYPDRWNILYNGDNKKSQAVPICNIDCMQIYVNRTKIKNIWVEPNGKETEMTPMELH